MYIKYRNISNCAQLVEFVNEIGFLPLLGMGVAGWSAEEQVSEDCGYTKLPCGGWEWPLWEWKGSVIRESGCAYGKFFMGKAGFISKAWWPDFCNWRRSRYPMPEEDSIETMILETLRENGSLITRELRAACGFTGTKMRSRFDTYITRLERGCHIVTEDFVYPQDRHGRQYGFGWSLLTTPESLYGPAACNPGRSPEESHARLMEYLRTMMPGVADELFLEVLG